METSGGLTAADSDYEMDADNATFWLYGPEQMWKISKPAFTIGRAPKYSTDPKRPDVDLRPVTSSKRISRLQVGIGSIGLGREWSGRMGRLVCVDWV